MVNQSHSFLSRPRAIWAGKFAAVLSVPFLIWAYPTGAPQRATGAPGDKTCVQSGCHTGTVTSNSSLVSLSWSGGTTYTPGKKQTFTVSISDTASQYGFEASARLASNPSSAQAGSFSPSSSATYVICDNGTDRPTAGCPASSPVEFITHTRAGSTKSWTFDWTPPADASAGNVTIYVAGNANQGPNERNAKVYLTSLTLSPASSTPKPTISSGGAVSASAFGGGSTIAPGSWLEIFGSNLSTTSRPWAGSDFAGSQAPKSLDGVSVTVDGKPAYVAYISPGQINVQVPDGIATGSPVAVVVTASGVSSDPVTLNGRARAPGLLSPSSFNVNGKQYVVAQFADGAYAGPPGLIDGLTFRLPKPGDRLVVYGVGFGGVSPDTPSGTVASNATSLPGLTVQIGSTTATAEYAGLAPNFVGLYQFNLVVPNVQAGDQSILMRIDGATTQSNLVLPTSN